MIKHAWLPVAALSLASCVGQELVDAPEATEATEKAASPIEDVKRYDHCLVHGVSTSTLDLGGMAVYPFPPIRSMFVVAECIVGDLKMFQGQHRPYQLQSYKTQKVYEQAPGGPGADTTFFFKRFTHSGEAPPECLKVKMNSKVGATDVFVTIQRVKQLPPTTRGGLCSDNGET